METRSPSRRQRLRQEALAEIEARALEQLALGGVAGVSLNGIAKAMGMSGPALYRYYPSRDDLLGALITSGYAELTRTLEGAVNAVAGRPADERLIALAAAYRGWAVAHPRYYDLLFGIRPSTFAGDDARAVDTVHDGMRLIVRLFVELTAKTDPPLAPEDELGQALRRWSQNRGDPAGVPVKALRLGVLTWSRLHGIVGLELTGALEQMDLDPTLLVTHEMQRLIAEAQDDQQD